MEFSRTQVAAFENAYQERFLTEVVSLCRRTLPQMCRDMPDTDLRGAVASSVQTAQAAGLTWKSNLASTCLLDLRYGRSVLGQPEFSAHLAQATAPDRVFRHLFAGEFAQIWTRFDAAEG